MKWYNLPIRRPVATSMFFAAILLLGIVGWQKIPIELVPNLEGDKLYVNFNRPNSEPELVEREILIPLEAKASELPGMKESWGEVSGSGGSFTVSFEPGTDIKVRQLDMQRLAIELKRNQPKETTIRVDAQDFSIISRFVMIIQVLGGTDNNALRSLVEDRIQSRLAAVTGVGGIFIMGGEPEEVTVRIDPDKCAALGISPRDVAESLTRSVHRLKFLGGLEDGSKRTLIMLDGRPKGSHALGEIRVTQDKPVLIRHVADVSRGTGRTNMLFRINSKPSVGLVVLKEEGANLIELGKDLRSRIDDLRNEFNPYGIDFIIGFDGAEAVEKQLDRLKKLAFSGFIIALIVLFLFIRRPKAVSVVAVSVPVSLLAAMAMLYTGGYTLNIVTLIGLAVGIGMLVDNSIVVYEAIQRRLERGMEPDAAAAEGVRITIRAIMAATVTTAIVFIPIAFLTEDAMIRGLLKVLAAAILLPLASSLLVAVGMVPLLSRKLAAPAALARIDAVRKRKELYAGLVSPDKWRELFSGLLKVSLRHPAGWLAVITGSVLITVFVAVPWLVVSSTSEEAREADEIRLSIDVPSGDSLEAIGRDISGLERAALDIDGVKYVESIVQENNSSLNIKFVDRDERPEDLTASKVRSKIREAAKTLKGINVRSEDVSGEGGSRGGGGSAQLFGQAPSEIVLSGPDNQQLMSLAASIKERLESIPEIGRYGVWLSAKTGQDEIQVVPDDFILTGLGLTSDQIMPMLTMLSREGTEMRAGMILDDGREIPLTVRSYETASGQASYKIERLKLPTTAGVLPLGLVSDAYKMPPPPMIQHHNGRRELSVFYRFTQSVPKTGLARDALDEEILTMIRSIHLPAGYIIDPPDKEESINWFKRAFIPMLLLLFAVLSVTFESLTMPVLVLFAVPLSILGSAWALALTGMHADIMAMAGAVVLLGLTVNPAILLVDRMQQRILTNSWSAGAAAIAAVRERVRPILMTTCTTIAGLWPLAIPTGRENEIWPSFAVVVMGGLATSSLLILLVVPMGFVFLNRLDRLFGRLGPWITVLWLGITATVMSPLIIFDYISSMTWQIITTLLVASVILGVIILLFRRPDLPEPKAEVDIEVKFLHKVYGRPGPVGRAWRSGEHFAERVLARGGKPFLPGDIIQPIIIETVLLSGAGYLAFSLSTTWWRLVFSFIGAIILSRILIQLRRLRGKCDLSGRPDPGGIEHLLAFLVPWIVFILLGLYYYLMPVMANGNPRLAPLALVLIAAIIIFIQMGRKTAKDLAAGKITERADRGLLQRIKTVWRRITRRLFSLDLPSDEVEALKNVHFQAKKGMIGILGPNGAGKTTLLRSLAGILVPTTGVINIGGISIKKIRKHLARWIGYLPQDFGLPGNLTGREYLEYYALLYDIGDSIVKKERVENLLEEVGLSDQADKEIKGYSGGMKQRVAVARTLLRLPPIIIVDEPTVGLDPRERIRFRNLLAKLAENRVVLFSTHVVEDVAVACERVIVLAAGKMVFDGEPSMLASEAEGMVWEFRIRAGEEKDIRKDAMIVDQIPEDEGFYRARVLCSEPPLPQARSIPPSLQDGYLQLVGYGMEREVTRPNPAESEL
jgi:multidrug efflux pump subunit AcrB/ABC-type multidrug transport system ATPase subunit